MNVTRIAILGVAAIAAGAAALLVRGMLGGGTTQPQALMPPPTITAEVLVASKDISPGRALAVDSVRWEAWPKDSVTDAFITKQTEPDLNKAVEGIVVRAPLVNGQPITDASIVRSGVAGFLAATIKPGMRAISMKVTAETGAGGFVLPNDRVDVILTRELGQGGGPKEARSQTILTDVRVLAIDQTAHQEKDQQTVVGKTATLELTPEQAEIVAQSEALGTLSIALRPLGDEDKVAEAKPVSSRRAPGGFVTVYRYGVTRNTTAAPGAVQ
jgi:pilus assembly protein CpaB